MESGSSQQSESHWKYGNLGHENGSKFWPSLKRKIWMYKLRELGHKLIEVSQV